MTAAEQAFLSAGELLCLSFAAIALVYFADKLRSGFLGKPKRVVPTNGTSHAIKK
jgi:hypothetical protein